MRFFRVTPPTAHQMLLTLERIGLISRNPRVPRGVIVTVDPAALPELKPGRLQPIKINVTGY